MENKIKSQINIIKSNFPKYLDNLPKENVRMVFDSFLDYNSSDEENFYEEETTYSYLSEKNKKNPKYKPYKLYNNYDDFEAGYEKNYYDESFNITLQNEDNKVKKVYLRDLLKIDLGNENYNQINKMFPPKKKIGKKNKNSIFNIKKNYDDIQLENYFFKSNKNIGNLNNNEDNKEIKSQNLNKIMIISNELRVNYKLLEPYIKNSLKYEDTSNIIEIKNIDRTKYTFKKINFRDNKEGKKHLFGQIDINDIVSRAQCLTNNRFNSIFNTMMIVIKFLTLLKRIKKKKLIKKNSENSIKPSFYKINNDIISFEKLNNFFDNEEEDNEIIEKKRAKKSEKDSLIVKEMTDKIYNFEKQKKEQLHQKLKKKMRNIIFNDDDSFDIINAYIDQNEDVINNKINENIFNFK